jgi:hypothetical protein
VGVQIRKRDFAVLVVVYASILIWYYVFSGNILKFIPDMSRGDFLTCNILFNLIICFVLVLGPLTLKKINEAQLFCVYCVFMLSGVTLIFFCANVLLKMVFYYLSGIAFGLGTLLFLVCFWRLTVPEERGRVSGLMLLISFLLVTIILPLSEGLSFAETIMLCTALSLGTLTIRLLGPSRAKSASDDDLRGSNPEKRTVILYLIPWLVFSFVNATLAKNVSFNVSQLFSPPVRMGFVFAQAIGTVLGATIGGMVADFLGRRLPLALGLTFYGLSVALSGLVKTPEFFYLVYLMNGATWGIASALYILVIFGDLASSNSYAQMCPLGLVVFHFSVGVGQVLTPLVFQIPLVITSLLSCLLFFVSIMPLILAPETLPLGFREKIRLKIYIYFAKRRL